MVCALPSRTAPVLVPIDAMPGPLKERRLAEFAGAVFHNGNRAGPRPPSLR
ncbi:hypothetical protein ACIGW0_18045 [Streptomyces bikiniensis]|uniref:Uncharacterized protein n=1 Tax=Streptomyces bikiniensis TaxID=1896 RepID=A0ABW8CVU6_STRBI